MARLFAAHYAPACSSTAASSASRSSRAPGHPRFGHTLSGGQSPGSPTAWRRSRRCSSSPRRTPTRRAPTAAPPRRSAARRSRSPSSCAPAGCASCAGSAPGIEARLRELVETGEIAELAELERELAPELVGLGRYLGLGAKRSVEIARALGVRTPRSCARRRPPAGCGPCRASGRRPRRNSSRRSPARPSRGRSAGCCSTARGSSWAASRPRSTARRPAMCGAGATPASALAVVCAAPRSGFGAGALRRAAADRRDDRAGRAPRAGRDGRRRTGRARRRRAASASAPRSCARRARPRTSPRSSRCRTRPTRTRSTGARHPLVPARAARGAVPRRAAGPARARRHPRRPPLPHDVVGRPGERRGDGSRRPRARL